MNNKTNVLIDEQAYNNYKHKQTKLSWIVINAVLTAAYLFECIKGQRSVEYVTVFVIMAWLPLLIFSICVKHEKDISDDGLEFIAGIGYLIFYSFAMLTTNNPGTFVYIFPMLCVFTVYCNKMLNRVVMIASVILNIAHIAIAILIRNALDPISITFYEIQIACIILCAVFLSRASSTLMLRDEMVASLSSAAYHDNLTKIRNRAYIDSLKDRLIERNAAISSVALIDIDKFKEINDTYGHSSGDAALVYVAEQMVSLTKKMPSTTVFRLGGDEFAIISLTQTKKQLAEVCSQLSSILLNGVKTPTAGRIHFSISAGVTNGEGSFDFYELYDKVDAALYKAKDGGRNTVTIV